MYANSLWLRSGIIRLMNSSLSTVYQGLVKWIWALPVLALGLYGGRLLSESLRLGLLGAIALTLVSILIGLLLLRRTPLTRSWPAFLLLLYVFYPESDPKIALAAALLALVTFLLSLEPTIYARFIPSRTLAIAGLSFIGIAFFFLYVNTLAPDVLPADSGELQLVASELGVAHPPGFPLYTLIANFFTRLPIGPSAAYRVNLLSAVASTLTLILVYLSVYELTRSAAAAILSGIALGTATTFWVQATTANIRALNGFFIALGLLALFKLAGNRLCLAFPEKSGHKEQGSNKTGQTKRASISEKETIAYLLLFLISLTLGISHHGSLLFIGLIFILVLFLARRDLFSRRYWPYFLLALIAGLLPLIYLFWRGSAGAVGAPDGLTTVSGFLDHVLARGFRGDLLYFDELSVLWERLKVMVDVFSFQFSGLLLLGFLIGLLLMLLHNRLLFLLIGGSIAFFTLIAATYRAPQTVEYLLPAYVLLAIGLGYTAGLVRKEQFSQSSTEPYGWLKRVLAPLLIALLYVAAIGQAFSRFPSYADLHQDTSARDYAQPLLDHAPTGATILADWHWVTPLWYLQLVEGQRPDLLVDFVFPTGEPYAKTWSRRISEEIAAGRPVIATHFDEGAFKDLPPFEPIGEAFLYPNLPRVDLPVDFSPLSLSLDAFIKLLGYDIESSNHQSGSEIVVTLAWQPDTDFSQRNMFLHLIDQSGQLYAQQDQPAVPVTDGITLSQFRLTPRLDTPAGTYDLLVGSYDPTELEGEVPFREEIAPITLSASSVVPYTRNRTNRVLVENPQKKLVGYDWDQSVPGKTRAYFHYQSLDGFETEIVDLDSQSATLPAFFGPWGLERSTPTIEVDRLANYVPLGQGIVWTGASLSNPGDFTRGQMLALDQYFTTSRPVFRDLIVSLRLVGYEDDGFHWNWWDLEDGVPAMGAIPTLKWIGGSTVRDPSWPSISESAWSGQVIEPLLRLYDAFTGRPLPILDERISEETPWIPLGKAAINPSLPNRSQ